MRHLLKSYVLEFLMLRNYVTYHYFFELKDFVKRLALGLIMMGRVEVLDYVQLFETVREHWLHCWKLLIFRSLGCRQVKDHPIQNCVKLLLISSSFIIILN